MSEKKVNVGGQAIIEGVMMRSPRSLAISIRRPNGQIVVTERVWESLWERWKFLRWPFVRGAVVLIESMVNGIQALMFSANQAMIEEEKKEKQKKEETAEKIGLDEEVAVAQAGQAERLAEAAHAEEGKDAITFEENTESPISRFALIMTLVGSLALGFFIFKGIPHMLTSFLGLSTDSASFHMLDGAIKISMFVGYVAAISLMPDMRRVFQYHGAEHKSIYAYENGEELTVENAKKYPTLHARCGTSFVIIVLLISIFIFMGVFPLLPEFHENRWINALLQVFVKLPLMLPIAGVSYEFLKWSSKHTKNPLMRALIAPGLWLQYITTREPDDEQLEIALVALRKALWRERQGLETLDETGKTLEVYQDFAEVGF